MGVLRCGHNNICFLTDRWGGVRRVSREALNTKILTMAAAELPPRRKIHVPFTVMVMKPMVVEIGSTTTVAWAFYVVDIKA